MKGKFAISRAQHSNLPLRICCISLRMSLDSTEKFARLRNISREKSYACVAGR